jgi:hypothetical protein
VPIAVLAINSEESITRLNIATRVLPHFLVNHTVASKMVRVGLMTVAAVAAVHLITTSAHPGHSIEEEIAERAAYLKRGITNLDHCSEKLRARGHERRSLNRRIAKIQEIRDELMKKSMSSPQDRA